MGVEFVEFAMDDASAPKLETHLMAHSAFAALDGTSPRPLRAGSRANINLVVNTEKEGFAHSFNITHGSAVCALGLKVDDAAATFERAKALARCAVPSGREASGARHSGRARCRRQP